MARSARVALLIESSRCVGREILNGVSSYMKTHDCWSVFHHERNLHDPAPRRLTAGNLPLARVAELAGFANVDWFSKLFHRKTGYTPRANTAGPCSPKRSLPDRGKAGVG